MAFEKDPALARAESMIHDVINVVPGLKPGVPVYPTADKNLEALHLLKQQAERHPEQIEQLQQQMVVAAAAYVKSGHTSKDALVSFFHTAPFAITDQTVQKLEQDRTAMRLMDGADGSKRDGRLTPTEIGSGLMKLGVYNTKLDTDHGGVADYNEIMNAVRHPTEFQAQRGKPGAGRA